MINKQYQDLFALVARNGAIAGEQALETLKDLPKEERTGEESTLKMVEAYRKLEDKIRVGEEELNLMDYVLLYTGSIISREILQKNVNTWSAIVHEYDTNLIPKLYEVAKETDDEKRNELIEKSFSEEKNDNEQN